MKATITILAAIFTLQAGILFAGNDNAPVTTEGASIYLTSLAPVTPAEAIFEEVVVMNEAALLEPVMPTEATFEEVASDFQNVAPLTPAVADFEDSLEVITVDLQSLAPISPAEADFE